MGNSIPKGVLSPFSHEFFIAGSPKQFPNGSYECNIDNIKLEISEAHRSSKTPDDTYSYYEFKVSC
jgi:hypothetical protein